MNSESSSYYFTTYSEDERIDKQLSEERNQLARRRSEEELARKVIFENYAEGELEIFDLPGIKFHTFRHNKIKFSFWPSELSKYVTNRVTFYVSLKYVGKYWRVKRDSLPVNYKWKVYRLFYRKTLFSVDDEAILDVLMKIYEILVEWTKEHEEFRLDKFERYKAGEDVELDSDDEQMFLDQSERVNLYKKRVQILKRMLPPTPRKRRRK